MSTAEDDTNPFTNKFTIEASEIRFKKKYNLGIAVVENDKPTSIWMNNTILKAIVKFSPSAKDMVFYIINHLGRNKEAIEIKYESYCLKTGLEINVRTFQRAIVELTNKVIEKKASRRNMYYINPSFIFNGSRITAYPTHVRVTYTDPTVTLLRDNEIIPKIREIPEATLNISNAEDDE